MTTPIPPSKPNPFGAAPIRSIYPKARPEPIRPQARPLNLSFADQNNEVALHTAGASSQSRQVLQQKQGFLENTVDTALRQASPPLSADAKATLETHLETLNTLGKTGLTTSQARKAYQQSLGQLVSQLKANHLYTGPVKAAVRELTQGAVQTIGQSQNISLETPMYRNKALGIRAPKNLSPEQKEALQSANDLLEHSQKLNYPEGKLTQEKLLLMSLRSELQRLRFEKDTLPPLEDPFTPTEVIDEKILINTEGLIDSLMESNEVPANLLSDLTKVVETARNNGGKGLQDALKGLNDLGSSASDGVASLNEGSADLNNLIGSLTDNLDAPNLVTPTNDILNGYISGSNAAVAALPTLPFPVVMPVPLNIPLGGSDSMFIPAGSALVSGPGGLAITTNGFGLNTGGTSITSGSGSILLGNNIDNLNMNSLNISTDDSNINLNNANILVDKVNNRSAITASHIDVDMTNGQVSMNNAYITTTPTDFNLGASQFHVENEDLTLDVNQVNFGQNLADDGTLTTDGTLQGVNLQESGGTQIQAGQLNFQLVNGADGTDTLGMVGQDLHVVSGDNTLDMGQAVLSLQSNPDGSSVTNFVTTDGAWTNGNQQVTTTAAGFQINQGPDGNLTSIDALAQDLSYTNGTDTLNVSEGALNITYGDNNQISSIGANISQADWASGDAFASVQDVETNALFSDTGQLQQLSGSVGQASYTNPDGTLDLTGGNLELNYDDSGAFSDGNFSADAINYAGTQSNGDPFGLNVQNLNGTLTAHPDGGQTLDVSTGAIATTVGDTALNVDNIEQFQVVTDANGAIESFHLNAPNAASVQTETLAATFNNTQINYDDSGLNASIANISGELNDPGKLTGQFDANGVQLWDKDQYTSVHLDSASADFQKLGEDYGLNVENVDLVLNKNDLGNLSSGELRFSDLEASLKEYTLTGTNQDGNQTVLSFGMSENGEWLQKMALEIPEGGELNINKTDDWFLKLGEQQKFEMNFDKDANRFTFNAENLNFEAGNADMTVDVGGLNGKPANMQISVTEEGGIVIDDISNLSGEITVKGMKGLGPVNIDIDKIKGYSTNNLSMQTTNNGMVLHLTPNDDDSVITAEVRTSYNKIPMGIKLKDVHELKAGVEMETNRAQVYIGDPSGRGQIEVYAGPLKLKGSEIQVETKYHTFDRQRMFNSLDKLQSDTNLRVIGDWVTVDPIKGKLTLDTGNKRGPYLQTNAMFTSPIRSAFQAMGADDHFMAPNGVRDDAFGLTFGTGARWTTQGGHKEHQLGVDFGLLPGSFVTTHVQKGQASLAGVPLPDKMSLGTTPYAGLNYKQSSENWKLGVDAGVFANPAAMAPPGNGFIYEDPNTAFGATAGVTVQKDQFHIGLRYMGTTPDYKQFGHKDSNHSVQLGVGFSW